MCPSRRDLLPVTSVTETDSATSRLCPCVSRLPPVSFYRQPGGSKDTQGDRNLKETNTVCALHGVSPRDRWLCVLPGWQMNVNVNGDEHQPQTNHEPDPPTDRLNRLSDSRAALIYPYFPP